jgi:pre-mRNA-splicing factor RBM22/SLT11
VQWGRTRPLGNIDRSQAAAIGRSAAAATVGAGEGEDEDDEDRERAENDRLRELEASLVKAPGEDEVVYPSQMAT